MNQSLKKIIFVTDTLSPSQPAIDTVLNLAKQHAAMVVIIDVVRQPSNLSRWLSSNVDSVFEVIKGDKQEKLEGLISQFQASGVQANGKVLTGRTSEAVTQAVIETGADLVVRSMKGDRSRYPGRFGNTSRNLMRICPCPVLFIGEQAVDNPRLLACVNAEHDRSENEAIFRSCEAIVSQADRLSGVYCWDLSGKEILGNYIAGDSLKQLLDESRQTYEGIFKNAMAETAHGLFAGRIRMEHGEPRDIIPQICQDESIDIVAMCSASLDHPLHRLLGSTIESVLEGLPCSLLVVKPRGFKVPMTTPVPSVEIGN